ncbi:MAG: cadherin-like domain-containing protein, partial [Planctomycetota bacterium]|nr:cadherin-like domain-containing protein [Planctomycetota bacterium]
SEEPAITQVRDIRSPADDEQHPVIVNEDFPTVLTLRGEGFVENDAEDPLTTFLINGDPLDPQYVEIISENEARLTLPASIDLSRETLTIGAENYVFVSQFTGVKGEVTAPQTLKGVPFNFPIVHNRPPRLHVAGPFQVMEDTPFQGRLLATDEDYDPVTFEIVSPPANGTLTLLNPQTGAFRFVPAQDFTGTTTFTARVVDRHGAASPTLTITLRVLPVPQPPGGEATGGAVSDAYGKGGTTGGCLAGGGLVAALLALLAILARGPLRLRRR